MVEIIWTFYDVWISSIPIMCKSFNKFEQILTECFVKNKWWQKKLKTNDVKMFINKICGNWFSKMFDLYIIRKYIVEIVLKFQDSKRKITGFYETKTAKMNEFENFKVL